MNSYCLLFALLASASLCAGPGQYRCDNPGSSWIIVLDMNIARAAFNDTYKIVSLALSEVTSQGNAFFFSGYSNAHTSAFHFDFGPARTMGTLTIVSEVSSKKQYDFFCEPTSLLRFF